MAEDHDLNDGKPWSEKDLEDLRIAIEADCTIEHAARFLSRETSVPEVEAKAREDRSARTSGRGVALRSRLFHDRISSGCRGAVA